jgi:hypothetical protein
MTMTTLYTKYTTTEKFELPPHISDLDTVYWWKVKWNILYIQVEKDGPVIDITASPSEPHEDYKRPLETRLENQVGFFQGNVSRWKEYEW